MKVAAAAISERDRRPAPERGEEAPVWEDQEQDDGRDDARDSEEPCVRPGRPGGSRPVEPAVSEYLAYALAASERLIPDAAAMNIQPIGFRGRREATSAPTMLHGTAIAATTMKLQASPASSS